jgi:hypothetical protein
MMRLLPRTPRGAWLLAAAVWFAGAVVVWYVLPEIPHDAWQPPEGCQVQGFTADSRGIIILRRDYGTDEQTVEV